MPHATIKLIPGVDTNKTPTLNEMAISYTDLVRFMPDRTGLGLVQKLGGWTRYIAGSFSAPIRALKAWSDLENTKYLAVGGESNVGVQVYNPSSNSLLAITPALLEDNETPGVISAGAALAAISNHTAVIAATTANLTATYNNGVSGVGATLTNSGTLAAISIDGVTLSVGNRILVKDQTTDSQNGVYSVTTVGSGSVAWVITRVTDFDAWGTGDIENGATFAVSSGTVNANKYFYCTNLTAVTVGTTSITFVQGAGFTSGSGTSALTFYTPYVPSSASYTYFPTIVNVGNINLLGPYDIVTIGAGFFTISVPSVLSYISKIEAVTSGSDRIVTIRFSAPHTLYATQNIYVSGVTTSTFNGSFTITSVTDYTITYTQVGVSTTATSNSGTVNARVNFGGVPPYFTTSSSSTTITVALVNHGYSVGDTFNIVVPTTVGGINLSGLYTVTEVSSATPNSFEITSSIAAASSASAYENSGQILAVTFVSNVSNDQGANYYYGGGVYNEGLYGSGYIPTPLSGTPIVASDWSLDNWGSILVACPKNGSLYYWQPVGGAIQNLSYMPNAPIYNSGAFVAMPQRQIIAYGSSFGTVQDPLLVRWCDLEDFTVWSGTANNQAGSYRIPTGSKIIGGLQAAQQTLLWTDLDLWSMTYIGQPYIYGFNKIGANAGLMSPKSASQIAGTVYWMSQKQFFKFAGQGVEPIPCPIWDQVFQNFYPGTDEDGNPYTDRIRCAANSQFNEITWYFPAHYTNDIDPATGLNLDQQYIGTGEVNAYVKYNVVLDQWDYGYQHPDQPEVLVGRTAWTDQSILGAPIGVGTTSSVNVNNGIAINGYFTGTCVYASGASSVATLYYTPISDAFVAGTNITVSSFVDSKFNGNFTVTSSSIGKSSAVTVTSASPGVVTWTNHGLLANSPVYLTSSQTMPTGLTANSVYFVKTVLNSNTFTVSATLGGTAINTSSTGTGSITAYYPSVVRMSNSAFASTTGAETSAGYVQYTVNAYVYQHETSNNADGAAMQSGFVTGYSAIADGDSMVFVDQVWPDMKWGFVDEAKTAEVKITFFVTNYPGDTPIQYGPYTVTQQTQYLSVRMRGRLIAIGVSSTDENSFWRLGAVRYRYQPDGRF